MAQDWIQGPDEREASEEGGSWSVGFANHGHDGIQCAHVGTLGGGVPEDPGDGGVAAGDFSGRLGLVFLAEGENGFAPVFHQGLEATHSEGLKVV